MAVDIADKRRELPCILLGIIDAAYQTVLKGNTPSGLPEIIPRSIEHLMNVIFICDRHKLLTLLLIRSVQRDRQRDLQLLICKPPDVFYNTAGRHGNISLTDIQSMFIGQKPDKFKQIVIIIQRLTGTHQHNV